MKKCRKTYIDLCLACYRIIIQIQIIMLRGKQRKLENLNTKRLDKSSNGIKSNFILEKTQKIQQKMMYLKQKIQQKKKSMANDKKAVSLQNDLKEFMKKIGMPDYLDRLAQNGIDSMQILKQVKQSELEEIGILKGHALKIMITLKKEQQKSKKAITQTIKSKAQSTLDDSAVKQGKKIKLVQQGVIYDTQTQSIPLQRIKKLFCLFCFTRSQQTFCTSKCQDQYNQMFHKYESNLQKAEQDFMKKQNYEEKQEQLSDNQEFLQNFDFLFNPQLQDIDEEEYKNIKELLRK